MAIRLQIGWFRKILISTNRKEIEWAEQVVVVRMASRRFGLLVIVGILAVISLSVFWYFATADYPTHSDVFWYGVIAGFLGSLLLACLALIGVLAYKLSKK